LLRTTDLAGAITLRAPDGLGPRLRARTATCRAWLLPDDLDLLLRSEDRLLKGNLQIVAQIRTSSRASLRGGAHPAEAAEELLEDVVEARETGPAESACAPGEALGARMAVTVIRGSAVGIAQDFVRFIDLLETFLGIGRLVYVRVILARQAPVGAFDGVIVRIARHAQYFVVIALAHNLSPRPIPTQRPAPYPPLSPGKKNPPS